MKSVFFLVPFAFVALLPAACSEEVGKKAAPAALNDGGPTAEGGPGETITGGEELRIPVPEGQRVYVSLASPPSIKTPASAVGDKTWDLAFEGLEAYTNGGASGSGAASASPPLDPIAFLDEAAPTGVPQFTDKVGGAFVRWYMYSGAPDHVLYSRLHVFGVKDGEKLYRVQVLTYYGLRDNTSVPALYKIRYSAVGQPAVELANLDGSAGGTTTGGAEAKSECLDLGTSTRTMLTPAEALASTAWHLCFRRDAISVNGGAGGPRGVAAVDFDADELAKETVAQVSARTPESEAARFDAITPASFEGAALRVDGIVSSFSSGWLEARANPVAPAKQAWLVVGADGKSRFLVGFPRFEGATATSVGTIVMRVKAVR